MAFGAMRWAMVRVSGAGVWGGGIPAAPAVDSRVGVDWVRQFSRALLSVVWVPLQVRRATVMPRWVRVGAGGGNRARGRALGLSRTDEVTAPPLARPAGAGLTRENYVGESAARPPALVADAGLGIDGSHHLEVR
ncbi:hypothetical protein [Rhodococcus wratislaviensis]|uniref:Uncharacterized protein n=1 Tax=Rhodococcus wratislaviensis NBRC 100605 TaxID=1219028 RepID=X0PZM0_RHOWR|nr:hypothetical protein [Rhodococcus wratislaviensis]GAF49144.1 hypothetical protein RW1_069_00120 [Rhodococcus wratislaviensis NBRC 100605]